jgi:hypothetical protein
LPETIMRLRTGVVECARMIGVRAFLRRIVRRPGWRWRASPPPASSPAFAHAGHPGATMPTIQLRPLLLALLTTTAIAAEPGYQVVVAAGAHDRHQTALSFAMPAGAPAGAWRLRDEAGATLAVQVDDRGRAHAVLPDLAKGEQHAYTLSPEPLPAAPLVDVQVDGDALRFSAAGRELCSYQGGAGELPEGFAPEFRRGGYLSRVFTPSGALVTDDYPPNHRHHHGVWFSWTKTVFDGRTPDFWNMGDKTGTVEFVSREAPWRGAAWAGLHAVHRYRDLGVAPAVTVLDETWDVTVQAPIGAPAALVIDLVVTDRCAGPLPLALPTYRYGGLGIRGNRAWDGKGNLAVLTSEGKARAEANETRGRWCHLGGQVDGRPVGIAVLSHPGNFRAPQPMRVHPTEPFFCFAPSQLGEWSIAPAEPLVLRYRLVVTDGAPDAADLDRRWNDYAEPPVVTVGK